jgi:hypothetical protein
MSIFASVIPTRLLIEMALLGILGGSLYFVTDEWISTKEELATYKAQVAQQAADQARVVRERESAQEARNAATITELQVRLDGIAADNGGLHRRLQQALNRSCPVPEAKDQPGATGTQSASGEGRLSGLLSDRLTECESNEARRTALIEELAGQ